MAYEAGIVLDSVNSRDERLTTFEVTLPRFVLAEFNTHRMFSRSSGSSRAIPVAKQLRMMIEDPVPTPIAEWGANRQGMQASELLDEEDQARAEAIWQDSKDMAMIAAVALIGGVEVVEDEFVRDETVFRQELHSYWPTPVETPVHKQIINRLLEPYIWHTVLVTATDYSNFFALRANEDASPEFRKPAEIMKSLYEHYEPTPLGRGEWHLPLIRTDETDMALDVLKKISVGRSARVSYLTHHGVRDPEKDVVLHDRLLAEGHMSPFEHVARPMKAWERWYGLKPYSGNFRGWHQYRKDIPNEADFSTRS